MAVLSRPRPAPHRIPGADAILAAHSGSLPQPDQLCGPFAASLALRAVLSDPPDLVDLAVAAGTRIWPHDVSDWRPAGAPLDRRGWDRLARAADISASGTDAVGLARGLERVVPDVAVVPVSGDWSALAQLLAAFAELEHPVGVLANVSTGPIAPPGLDWEVGHFVILWAVSEDGAEVAIADSYVELGAPDQPLGCRLVAIDALAAALPDRGLMVLVAHPHAAAVRRVVSDAGLTTTLWAT